MARGPHARDPQLFSERWIPRLRQAVDELSWLLSRGYAENAATKLVGDRHQLRARQRDAVRRCACAAVAVDDRRRRRVGPTELRGEAVRIDGFNCLITVETALAGGVVLLGRDGAHRDIASIHGTYRRIKPTGRALALIGAALQRGGATGVTWLLDRPVSNSGKLAGIIRRTAEAHGFAWTVEMHNDPDRELVQESGIAATSDAEVLDRCGPWMDLPAAVIERDIPDAWIVDLR